MDTPPADLPSLENVRTVFAAESPAAWSFARSLLRAIPGIDLITRTAPDEVAEVLDQHPEIILLDAGQYENDTIAAALARLPATSSIVLLSSPDCPTPLAAMSNSRVVDCLMVTELTHHRIERTVETCRRHGRLQKSLETAARQQGEAGDAISSITGGIAHEINNVLTIILANVELLPGERGLPDEEAMTREIRDAARRGAAMTSKMLKLSRHDEPKPTIVEFAPLLSELVTTLRPILREDITLETFGEDLDGSVDADPNSIHQIALNLVNNAMDAMPSGGHIRMGLRATLFDSLYCASHPGSKPGRYLALVVEDTGEGMDEATRHNVFEPFFTTKPPGRGTGLGLAVVYGLTKQFNGYVDVYSELGTGTQFLVHFPRVERAARVSGTFQAAAETLQRGQETVLLVEDEPHVLQVGQRILERLGYSVLVATNGQEGLEVLDQHRHKIDIVFTDVVMPVLGGRDMYALMKQGGVTPPVVFTSGYSHDSLGHPIAAQSQDPFLRKPWSMEGLASEIRRVLDTAASEDHRHRFLRQSPT